MKKRRFFFHYRRATNGMTIHWKNECIPVVDVVCKVACETKRNKKQPKLVMQGFAKNVSVHDGIGVIE